MFLSSLQIWAGLPAGSLVTNMFAKDLDAGENGTVTFSLVSGELWTLCTFTIIDEFLGIITILCFVSADLQDEGFGHFEIDSESGDIRTTELFTENTGVYYTLKVTANDDGATPLEDTALIHVQVQSSLHSILLTAAGYTLYR